ncbi:Protein geranylgeranyltransferase/Protein farnesyltransferase [Giardia muris]|uniref:Protein geranylgeranyltransferase/Protein farnesyltransferase n=1 Tax=Giardia muris TaxID=5742 RepID=A0A4Z1SNA6_GIAMU|nr:Protein geranylgeranyltransferase/Protein farnesyltransferase [Giardia muris]|eukprot:TNJ27244.1 Protein geranylgeranyltransferase/Protein farnesyltransferase [Giardia muris]
MMKTPGPFETNFSDAQRELVGRVEASYTCGATDPGAYADAFRLAQSIPTNPTAYSVLLRCVREGSLGLERVISDSMNLCLAMPKSFQSWAYRLSIMSELPIARALEMHRVDDKQLIDQVLKKDRKNYHALDYHLSVLSRLVRTEGGSALIKDARKQFEQHILDDYKNNSAWAFRLSCLRLQLSVDRSDLEHLIQGEMRFIQPILELTPRNASLWDYVKGLHDLAMAAAMEADRQALYDLVCNYSSTDDDAAISPEAVMVRYLLLPVEERQLFIPLVQRLVLLDPERSEFWKRAAQRLEQREWPRSPE